MRGTEFLEKMELVDPVYIEAADQLPQNTPREKSRRTTAAALRLAVVLCAVFAIVFLCRAYIKKPVVPHKDEFSGNQKLAEYTSIYDGTLLAARLAPPGTRISEILLKYAEDGDVSEPSTWKSLSVSVEYEDSSVNLFCLFDGSAESDPSSELLETLQYGDTTVRRNRCLPERQAVWNRYRPTQTAVRSLHCQELRAVRNRFRPNQITVRSLYRRERRAVQYCPNRITVRNLYHYQP